MFTTQWSRTRYPFSVRGMSCCGTPSLQQPGVLGRPAEQPRWPRRSYCCPFPSPRSLWPCRKKTCRAGWKSSPGWPAPGERAAAPLPPSWVTDGPAADRPAVCPSELTANFVSALTVYRSGKKTVSQNAHDLPILKYACATSYIALQNNEKRFKYVLEMTVILKLRLWLANWLTARRHIGDIGCKHYGRSRVPKLVRFC